MGQVLRPKSPQTLILTADDRLIASNADGGLYVAAAHVVLLGVRAGRNMAALSYVYVIGADSLAGGAVNAANSGMAIYGGLILSALVNTPSFFPQGPDGPSAVVGYNIAPLLTGNFNQNAMLGPNILRNYRPGGTELFGDVFIGAGVQENNRILNANGGTNAFNVMIGYNVARGAVGLAVSGAGTVFGGNVFIGAEVVENHGFDGPVPGSVCANNVFIGRQVGRAVSSGQNTNAQANVFIGNAVGSTFTRGSENVAVGSGIAVGNAAFSDMTSLILVGANITHNPVVAASGNIIIGAGAIMSGMGSGNVFIGHGVNGDNAINAGSLHFLLASNVGASVRNLLYGKFADVGPGPGGLILGNSSNANRDIPGFNVFKILNGSWDGTPPIGGGLLYGAAGGLHWVDTNGNDSLLAGPGGEIAPPALAAGVTNNWAPAGIGSAVLVEVTVDAGGSQLSGMTGGFPGHQVTLFVSGGQLDLNDEDAGSLAANRFHGVSGAGIIVADGQSVTLLYDGLIDRWRPIASF